MAADCIDLLYATTDTLSGWSALVGKSQQQQQQHQQHQQQQQQAVLRQLATDDLHQSSIWLSAAAGTLLLCLQKPSMRRAIDAPQLLFILGQLAHQVTVMHRTSQLCSSSPCQALPEHARSDLQLSYVCLAIRV
jgi:hypothetical protein